MSNEFNNPEHQKDTVKIILEMCALDDNSARKPHGKILSRKESVARSKEFQKVHQFEQDVEIFFREFEDVLNKYTIAEFLFGVIVNKARRKWEETTSHEDFRIESEKALINSFIEHFEEYKSDGMELDIRSLRSEGKPIIYYSEIPLRFPVSTLLTQATDRENLLFSTILNLTHHLYKNKTVRNIPLDEFLRRKGIILKEYVSTMNLKSLVEINPYFRNENFFKVSGFVSKDYFTPFKDSPKITLEKFLIIFHSAYSEWCLSQKDFFNLVQVPFQLQSNEEDFSSTLSSIRSMYGLTQKKIPYSKN